MDQMKAQEVGVAQQQALQLSRTDALGMFLSCISLLVSCALVLFRINLDKHGTGRDLWQTVSQAIQASTTAPL